MKKLFLSRSVNYCTDSQGSKPPEERFQLQINKTKIEQSFIIAGVLPKDERGFDSSGLRIKINPIVCYSGIY